MACLLRDLCADHFGQIEASGLIHPPRAVEQIPRKIRRTGTFMLTANLVIPEMLGWGQQQADPSANTKINRGLHFYDFCSFYRKYRLAVGRNKWVLDGLLDDGHAQDCRTVHAWQKWHDLPGVSSSLHKRSYPAVVLSQTGWIIL